MEENKKKLLVPVLGSVNSGKTTFLNSLFNLNENILEIEDKCELKTKFGCIIRYNKNLKEPQFYHVTLEHKNDITIYNKDGRAIEGTKNIIEEIKKINEKVIDEKNFSNFFYILEINIIFNDFLMNSSFFDNYDLLDIPGINYFQDEELKNIFNSIKGNIKFCIYIFDSEYFRDIIENIKNITKHCGLNFTNSLFILNKIDKIKKKEIVNEFKLFLFENISNIFDYSNSIIALDSISLKYENLCKYNFEHLLNYYFKKYIEELNKNEDYEFLELIKDLLFEIVNINNLPNIDDFLKNKKVDINADEFEIINNIIKNLSENAADARIKFNFDLENMENKSYIKPFINVLKRI